VWKCMGIYAHNITIYSVIYSIMISTDLGEINLTILQSISRFTILPIFQPHADCKKERPHPSFNCGREKKGLLTCSKLKEI
jgi:hypothetical protein